MNRSRRWCRRCQARTEHWRDAVRAHRKRSLVLIWAMALPVIWVLNPWRSLESVERSG
jgi:hypothetical protein